MLHVVLKMQISFMKYVPTTTTVHILSEFKVADFGF